MRNGLAWNTHSIALTQIVFHGANSHSKSFMVPTHVLTFLVLSYIVSFHGTKFHSESSMVLSFIVSIHGTKFHSKSPKLLSFIVSLSWYYVTQ